MRRPLISRRVQSGSFRPELVDADAKQWTEYVNGGLDASALSPALRLAVPGGFLESHHVVALNSALDYSPRATGYHRYVGVVTVAPSLGGLTGYCLGLGLLMGINATGVYDDFSPSRLVYATIAGNGWGLSISGAVPSLARMTSAAKPSGWKWYTHYGAAPSSRAVAAGDLLRVDVSTDSLSGAPSLSVVHATTYLAFPHQA